VIQTDYRRKCTVHVIKHFVLKILWMGFLSNVAINPKICHTATVPYFIHWYTYILSVVIYKGSDMVAKFITWIKESMITGGVLSHALATNLYAALTLYSRVSTTLQPEVSILIVSLTSELLSCCAFYIEKFSLSLHRVPRHGRFSGYFSHWGI
jgi:hypothetical protein